MKSISAIVILPVLWQVFVRGQQPEFNAKPVNITAIKGQPAVLPCTVLHKNDYLLVWMNPRRILLSSDDRRVIDDTRMSIERPFVRDWNLHVRNVQVHDDGEYTCQINTDPIQIKRILLKVQVPAEIVNATSSTNITIREGSKVKLQCVATGTPKPSIIWYRNTPQTNDIKEHIGTNGEVLIIHNISRYCGGLYECEANNNIAKPVSRAMNVDVQFPPEVTFRTPRRISQVIGKEAMLECFVSAFPHGVGTWNKNGKPVGEGMENSWKYRKEIYKEDHFTYAIYLRILNLEAHDFGTYTCEAANPLGTDSDTMLLSEYFVPTPPPTTKGPPMHPSRHPPHNVGHSDKHYEYRHPSEDGEINIGGVHSSSGNVHTFGYVGAGESYPSRCASIFQQTTPLWCIQTTVTVTLLVYRTLFPS